MKVYYSYGPLQYPGKRVFPKGVSNDQTGSEAGRHFSPSKFLKIYLQPSRSQNRRTKPHVHPHSITKLDHVSPFFPAVKVVLVFPFIGLLKEGSSFFIFDLFVFS